MGDLAHIWAAQRLLFDDRVHEVTSAQRERKPVRDCNARVCGAVPNGSNGSMVDRQVRVGSGRR
jgi:hypothetical protein